MTFRYGPVVEAEAEAVSRPLQSRRSVLPLHFVVVYAAVLMCDKLAPCVIIYRGWPIL